MRMAPTRLRRTIVPALMVVLLTATAALAAITWPSPTGSHETAGPKWTWNYGSSMDKTGNDKLALVYSTDFIKGEWATDAGPYQGTYVMTGAVDGATGDVSWSKGKKVSQGTKHAERPSLASGGGNVYAIWVTQTSYDNYDATKPRVAYVRVNTSNGAAAAWGSPIKLSAGKGRVDYPVVAADGNNAYVVWTDSDSGKMFVSRSSDGGATWAKKSVGTTARTDGEEGFAGWPGICADGDNVGVVWLGTNAGRLNYAISQDGGGTYPTTDNLGTGAAANFSWSQCDAVGARIGVTWTTTTALKYREYNTVSDSWGAERTAAAFTNLKTSSTTDYESGYAPAVALNGASTVGIVWGDCRTLGCDYYANRTRIDASYVESTNSGLLFSGRVKLADSGVSGKAMNDSANIVFYDSDTRYVVYNGWTANYSNYRLYLVKGEGT